MKYDLDEPTKEMIVSPPARGAWIEMAVCAFATVLSLVAPRTGGVD